MADMPSSRNGAALTTHGRYPQPLDVHFISSLPVMWGTVYKAWVDSTPVQMVWGGD
jgi:hypothetical protein